MELYVVLLALMCSELQVCTDNAENSYSPEIYCMAEKLLDDVKHAISSVSNVLNIQFSLAKNLAKYEFLQLNRRIFQADEVKDEECDRMEVTLRDIYDETANVGKILANSTWAISPHLEEAVYCEMESPLLWIHCVLKAMKQVTAIVVYTRNQIVEDIAVYKHLASVLNEEYNACARTYG